MDTCHSTSVQMHGMYNIDVNHNVNYELWVTVMCRRRFINWDKFLLWRGTLVIGGIAHSAGGKCMGNLHLLFNFAVNLNFSFKKSLYKRKTTFVHRCVHPAIANEHSTVPGNTQPSPACGFPICRLCPREIIPLLI